MAISPPEDRQIPDFLEVTAVPVAVPAAQEDIPGSTMRLAEILTALATASLP